MAGGRCWDEADKAIIREMVAAGAGARQVLEVMPHRTLDAVRTQMGRMGLRMTRDEALARCIEGRARAKAAGKVMGRRKGCQNRPLTDEERKKRGAAISAALRRPDIKARHLAANRLVVATRDNAEVGRKVSNTKLAWCPAHLRHEYHLLYNSKRIKAADAKQMILAEWLQQLRRTLNQIAAVAAPLAKEQRRRHNSIEGQIERIKAGTARVVPTFKLGRVLTEHRSLIGGTMSDIAA